MAEEGGQIALGFFGPPLRPGMALARQKDMARKINMLCEVMETIRGIGGLRFVKPVSARDWAIVDSARDPDWTGDSGSVPEGFSERENTVIDIQWDASGTKLQVKRGTVLVKDAETEWTDLVDFEQFDA